jgi:hypothetical protein
MGKVVQLTEPAIFEREDCHVCGVIFFVPQDLQMRARRDGRTFYCPNGHGAVYMETDLAKAQKLARDWEAYSKAETARKDRALADANEQRAAREQTQRRLSATIGAKTRIVNRIKNGVCPCCNRTFVNLHQHMTTQHPGFQKKETTEQSATTGVKP